MSKFNLEYPPHAEIRKRHFENFLLEFDGYFEIDPALFAEKLKNEIPPEFIIQGIEILKHYEPVIIRLQCSRARTKEEIQADWDAYNERWAKWDKWRSANVENIKAKFAEQVAANAEDEAELFARTRLTP